jgi:hypothetical protein
MTITLLAILKMIIQLVVIGALLFGAFHLIKRWIAKKEKQ